MADGDLSITAMSRESALDTAQTRCGLSGGTGIALLGSLAGMNATVAVFERVPSDVAQKLDGDLDDGNAITGVIRDSSAYATGTIVHCFGMPVF